MNDEISPFPTLNRRKQPRIDVAEHRDQQRHNRDTEINRLNGHHYDGVRRDGGTTRQNYCPRHRNQTIHRGIKKNLVKTFIEQSRRPNTSPPRLADVDRNRKIRQDVLKKKKMFSEDNEGRRKIGNKRGGAKKTAVFQRVPSLFGSTANQQPSLPVQQVSDDYDDIERVDYPTTRYFDNQPTTVEPMAMMNESLAPEPAARGRRGRTKTTQLPKTTTPVPTKTSAVPAKTSAVPAKTNALPAKTSATPIFKEKRTIPTKNGKLDRSFSFV